MAFWAVSSSSCVFLQLVMMKRGRRWRKRRRVGCCSVSRSWVFRLQTSAALLSTSRGRTPLPPPTVIVSLWVSKSDLFLLLLLFLHLLSQTRDDHLTLRGGGLMGRWGAWWDKQLKVVRGEWNQNINAKFTLPMLLSNNVSVRNLVLTHHPCTTYWKMQDKNIQI